MKTAISAHRVLLCGLVLPFLFTLAGGAGAQTAQVLLGSNLMPGYDMGVNSSGGGTTWIKKEGEFLRMSYPAGQSWGAVFITVGAPSQPPRSSRDFSAFETLSVDMKGDSGGERLEVGIKANDQPDDGSESKRSVHLTSEWHSYRFPLSEFGGADLRRVYVVAEFVFSGTTAQTVYLRDVRYAGGRAARILSDPPTRQAPPPSPEPQVSISYPSDHSEVVSPAGKRPSILARGTVTAVPTGSRLFLIVHPVQSDNVWAKEIALSGGQWIGQAYFGGSEGLPGNGEEFEVFAVVVDQPLPSTFVIGSQLLARSSSIVRVRVKTVSWLDRVVSYSKDLQVSGPIAAFFTALGGIIGAILVWRSGRHRTTSTG